MANTDDTARKQDLSQLERFIDIQRRKLLQAHSVMHCLTKCCSMLTAKTQ